MDGSGGMPSWNHAEFRMRYSSLANQLSVSGIYVKLLLDGLDQVQSPNSHWHIAYTSHVSYSVQQSYTGSFLQQSCSIT